MKIQGLFCEGRLQSAIGGVTQSIEPLFLKPPTISLRIVQGGSSMLNNEAPSIPEPHNVTQTRQVEGKLKWTILLLFTIVLALGIMYAATYTDYIRSKRVFDQYQRQIHQILSDNSQLGGKSETLLTENTQLKSQNDELREQTNQLLGQLQDFQNKYNELTRKVAQIEEDNIALQNSLKMAAAVGIKPQNYTKFNGVNSRGDTDREQYLGKFLGTAYTPSNGECGNNKGITNSGKPIIPGVSIAVDSQYWPFGTIFYIKGLGYAVAMDTGNAIKGKYRFDFAVFDRKFALNLGEREWDVYLIRMGNGKIENIQF